VTEGFPRKFGKYHLLAPLAQGGMGALYLSVTGEKGLEKLCVIKTVLPHLADSEYVARFRDEAKVVVKLSHGNLVPVFDAGQEKGEIFLAMDFIEGKDLRAVWNRCAKKGVAFPVDVAVYIVKELCRGLAYAHGFGDLKLVHRDVSPPNVLISFAGEIKLTDFGLASSTLKLEKTAPGVIYGKVSYMSPEQARGEPLDGRTDLYAAGIILWELLTGRQLFPPGDAQPQDLLARAKDPRPDPPSRRAPRVPGKLDDIVLKALAASREERYRNGEEMRAALAGWLAQEAPATDSARLEKFVTGLFAEDMQRERAEREALVEKTRDRIRSSPHDVVSMGQVRTMSPSLHTKRGVAVTVPDPGPGGATIVTGGGSAPAVATQPDEDLSVDVLGTILDGRYAVKRLLGEGGMGRVYEAEHVQIGKRVALKILHPAYSRTPEVVARFRREARAASRIGHPNIVDVTDSGTTADGSVYFVMEFLEGVELADVIDREGAIDVSRALNIGTQICRALAAAHSSGIIHRDLKPENIFLVVREGTTDFVKVLDFGIAKSAELEEQRKERLTHPGMAMGTPEYMAPEQAAGRPADARSDVYAVGAIMYEMVTGVPPYDGANFMEILTKKATVEPVPPRQLRTDLPEVVERVILRSLARSPSDRPPSMEAFEYELTKCLAGRGVAVAKMLGMPVDPTMMLEGGAGMGASGGTVTPAALGGTSQPAPLPLPAPEVIGVNTGRVDLDGLAALGAPHHVGMESSEDATQVVVFHRSSVWWLLFYGALIVGLAAGGFWFVTRQKYESGTKATDTMVTSPDPAAGPTTSAPGGTGSNGSSPPPPAAAPGSSGVPALPVVPGESPPGAHGAAGSAPAGSEAAPSGASGAAASSASASSASGLSGGPDGPPAPPATSAAASLAPAASGAAAHEPGARVATSAADDPPREDRHPGPPRDKREAEQMLGEARASVSQMDWTHARSLYDKIARGKLRRAEGLLGIANVAFQTKDFDTALEYISKSLQAGGGDPARVLLGHVYMKRGLTDEAIAQYRKVLEHDPNNREARDAFAETQQRRRPR
jgi:serine/threonine protein kinase